MRVLFVDDEPSILEGFRRMLCDMRHEWHVEFAGSGREALGVLDCLPVDVVVTDMRMPGMDGAALLEEVKRRHPQVVRIVLSGQSESSAVLRSIGATHQYLAKPCDPDTLKQTLTGTRALRGLLAEAALRDLVSRLGSLPSPPSLYFSLLRECRAEQGSQKRVTEIIEQDPAMTASVLRLVNSAFFGRYGRVSDPLQAVLRLGLNTVKAFVLFTHILSEFSAVGVDDFSADALQQHSAMTSTLARLIAGIEGAAQTVLEDASGAGLLHDIGQLVLAARLPADCRVARELAGGEGIQLDEAERVVFGTTHAAVGAYLLGLWGLPATVVEAVALHHEPHRAAAPAFGVLTAVHVADVLASESGAADPDPTAPRLDAEYLAALGVADRVDVWREACRRRIEKADG